jgi:hypothetical protein
MADQSEAAWKPEPAGATDESSDGSIPYNETEADDDASIGTKRPRIQKPRVAKRRRRIDRKPLPATTTSFSGSASTEQPAASHTLRLAPSSETFNLNVWLAALPDLSVKAEGEVVPTELGIGYKELRPLGQLPDMPGRKFKYSIASADIKIDWDPQPGDDKGPGKYSTAPVQAPAMNKWRRTHTDHRRRCASCGAALSCK